MITVVAEAERSRLMLVNFIFMLMLVKVKVKNYERSSKVPYLVVELEASTQDKAPLPHSKRRVGVLPLRALCAGPG